MKVGGHFSLFIIKQNSRNQAVCDYKGYLKPFKS